MDLNASNVRYRASQCLDHFKLLLQIQDEVLESEQAGLFQPQELTTEDQLARFEMWAGNIGVFAEGHGALDYRLRYSEDARTLMTEFLETLREVLQRAIEGLRLDQSPDFNRGQMSSEHSDVSSSSDIEKLSDWSGTSSSFQGTETDSLLDVMAPTSSPLEQRLQVIGRTIDRLYRLSLIIRQPSVSSKNTKADNFPILDEDGNAIDAEFAKYATEIVKHSFPEAPADLRESLSRGIVIRRKRFLYRQRHQHKLSLRSVVTVDLQEHKKNINSDDTEAVTVKGKQVLLGSTSPNLPIKSGDLKVGNIPSQTSASAMAQTSIPREKVYADEGSRQSTVFTTTLATSSPVQVPDPPKPAPGSKEFECPYCCIVLPISYAKASNWRRHVLKDLEPYSCVFEDCSDQRRFFSDKSSWVDHMRNSHSTRWLCSFAAHKSYSFQSGHEWADHMDTAHKGTFTEAQRPILEKRARAPSLVTLRQCPLCGFVPTADDLPATSDHLLQSDFNRMVSDRILSHLASHLEILALKALPWQDVGDELKSEKVESGIASEGSAKTEDDSRSEGRKLSTSAWQSEGLEYDENDDSNQSDREDVKNNVPAIEGQYEAEWGFIPLPVYYGHDRDPVLQKHLRKLYLGSSHTPGSTTGPKGPRLPFYSVPVDQNKDFFARGHALKAIEEVLCPKPDLETGAAKPATYPRCFSVYGPGGMGKTQIAAQFVGTHRNQFDAVLWVHAENASKILQDFNEIAIDLGLVSSGSIDATDQSFTRDIVKRWLVSPVKQLGGGSGSNKEKASWLLVFDGVESGEVLNDFWPYDGPGSILITSRNPYSWTTSLELKPFSIAEGSKYLVHMTGRVVSDEEQAAATKIAGHLSGLPLALAQMAAIINHQSMSFSEFLRNWEERSGQQRILQWDINAIRPRSSKYEHNFASVWAFDSLSPETITLLKVLSLLDPDWIPEKLFDAATSRDDPSDIIELKHNYNAARDELLARSLVTHNKRTQGLYLHRLVQDVARVRMGASELRQVFVTCVRLVSGQWPFELFTWRHGVARWGKCEDLFPHIARLKEFYTEISPTVDSFEDYPLAKLLIDAGWYHHERGKSKDAILFNNMAQSICDTMKLRLLEHPEYNEDNTITLAQLNFSLVEITHNRGCIALEINEPVDALKYHRLFNSTMVTALAGKENHNDMRLAISWNELGNAHMLNREWSKGEQCFVQSIEEMKRLKNFTPTMISLPVANLGLAFWIQKKYDQALQTLEEGLRERESAYGKSDRVSFITGRILHALGNVKGSQGLQDQGLDYHRRTLLHYKSTLGNRHHRTADVLVKVAEHNIRLNQYEMSLALLDHALEAYSNAHHFKPEKARASFKRSLALRALMRIDEADGELSKCFRLYIELYTEMVRNGGARAEDRKTKEVDVRDSDFDELIAFWSK